MASTSPDVETLRNGSPEPLSLQHAPPSDFPNSQFQSEFSTHSQSQVHSSKDLPTSRCPSLFPNNDGNCTSQDCPSTWYPYTPQEYASVFLNFYQFLTTLQYSPSDLKIPPPGDWPHLTRKAGAPVDYNTDFTLEVMRHLPYIGGKMHYEYKFIFIDYSTLDPKTSYSFKKNKGGYPADDWFQTFHSNMYEGEPPRGDCLIPLTCGWEGGGVVLLLDVKKSEIVEDVVRCQGNSFGVQEYIDRLKVRFSKLKLIPCDGRLVLPDKMQERDTLVMEKDFWDQNFDNEHGWHDHWGTDVDIAYIKQVYRGHRWPDNFRREECFRFMNALMEKVQETRDSWEEWDDGHLDRAQY
ncbi:hypothetical protein QBC36DRAFT_363030 [Triangularia setosa]|uniref:Uncharacterized protein n=1 Tax=Triangularia setosa TaxID=2587417 RepID=A0AAN6VYY6_9PEZI|nr:hypothetical protein QBC36DRAFT_363030 [Podospora setosa]